MRAYTSTELATAHAAITMARTINGRRVPAVLAAGGSPRCSCLPEGLPANQSARTAATAVAAHAVAPPASGARPGGVRVKGVGDLLVRFAKCCHPIPGDPIVGFITRGKGVTVHLRSCPTVLNEREVSRLIEVEWEAAPAQTYPIAIRVEAYDRTGLLSDITQVVADNKVNILAAQVKVAADHTTTVTATLQVASVSQLARVMSRIEQLKDVLTVQRDLS